MEAQLSGDFVWNTLYNFRNESSKTIELRNRVIPTIVNTMSIKRKLLKMNVEFIDEGELEKEQEEKM